MASDNDIERRLLVMALWYHTREAGGHYAFTSAYQELFQDGYRESSVPLMIGEAMETFDALQRLPDELGLPLWAHYLRIGPQGEKLRDLNQAEIARKYFNCGHATYERWLKEGRVRIRIEIRIAKDVANAPYLDAA